MGVLLFASLIILKSTNKLHVKTKKIRNEKKYTYSGKDVVVREKH